MILVSIFLAILIWWKEQMETGGVLERITFFVFIPMGIWFYKRVTPKMLIYPGLPELLEKVQVRELQMQRVF
jgi:hypothetical protein